MPAYDWQSAVLSVAVNTMQTHPPRTKNQQQQPNKQNKDMDLGGRENHTF